MAQFSENAKKWKLKSQYSKKHRFSPFSKTSIFTFYIFSKMRLSILFLRSFYLLWNYEIFKKTKRGRLTIILYILPFCVFLCNHVDSFLHYVHVHVQCTCTLCTLYTVYRFYIKLCVLKYSFQSYVKNEIIIMIILDNGTQN